MAFDQSTITAVTAARVGADLRVAWSSTSPAGTNFQVYVGRRLAWRGTSRSALVPHPPSGVRVPIDVGTVGAAENNVDFAADLPLAPGTGRRAALAWRGGSYLADDIASFHIYMGTAPGGAVSYAAPVATVNAYPGGFVLDGFGNGGFGDGGFGRAAGDYSWTSAPLPPGVWNFAIKPADGAGNEGTAATVSVTLSGPPRPPAADANGVRLTYTYNAGTRVPTLSWSASP